MALKKIGADAKEGVHITALREIKILESLKHDNVVSLIEVVRSQGNSTNQTVAILPLDYSVYLGALTTFLSMQCMNSTK